MPAATDSPLRTTLAAEVDPIEPKVWLKTQTGLEPAQVGARGTTADEKMAAMLTTFDEILDNRFEFVEMTLDTEAGTFTWPPYRDDGSIDESMLLKMYPTKDQTQRHRILQIQLSQGANTALEFAKGDAYALAAQREPKEYAERAAFILGADGRPGNADRLLSELKRSVRAAMLGPDRTPDVVEDDDRMQVTDMVPQKRIIRSEYTSWRRPWRNW